MGIPTYFHSLSVMWYVIQEEPPESRASLPMSSVLDGCIIYLAGLDACDATTRDALIDLVRKGTGTRAPRAHSRVSHVVVAHHSALDSR